MALRGPALPDGVIVEIGAARPLPADWERWRDALLEQRPAQPIVEQYTLPEGWSVTIVELPGRVHAFYAILDRAVHAIARVPAAAPRDVVERVCRAFREAAPVWDDEIVALGDL